MQQAETISFGHTIKQRRERLGLTREQLARKVGCAAVTVYKIEINARGPRCKWSNCWQSICVLKPKALQTLFSLPAPGPPRYPSPRPQTRANQNTTFLHHWSR